MEKAEAEEKHKCPTCDFESTDYDEVKEHSWYCSEKEED